MFLSKVPLIFILSSVKFFTLYQSVLSSLSNNLITKPAFPFCTAVLSKGLVAVETTSVLVAVIAVKAASAVASEVRSIFIKSGASFSIAIILYLAFSDTKLSVSCCFLSIK